MTTLRRLSLAAAAAASLATSAADPPGTTPIAPYTDAVVLAPGQSVQADFRVGVPLGQLGAVQTSWASAAALLPAQTSDAEVEVTLVGAIADDAMSYTSSPDEPYEDAFQIDGLFSGCIESGGTCWTTWTMTVSHAGGADPVEVHWAFDTIANGVSGPIAHQVLEF